MPIFGHGRPLGQWASVSWDPRRFLAPYAEQFVDELVAHVQGGRPWPGLASPGARRPPPLRRPKEPVSG